MTRHRSADQEISVTEADLASFVDKFDPDHRALIRRVREILQHRFPTAYELVYDNYNFFVIGYSPTARPSDSILSVTANASGVGLCFIHGAKLADPHKLLVGSGKQTRFIRIPSVDLLAAPEVRALIDAAEVQSGTPFKSTGLNVLVIRSVSKKQRPRRK